MLDLRTRAKALRRVSAVILRWSGVDYSLFMASETRPQNVLSSHVILQAALIVVAPCLTFWPALRGGYVWDDDRNLTANATVRSLDGLRQIWLAPGSTQQYYPLTYTSYWVEYHLWRLWPGGYHVVNL